jgi:glucosamine--fructose-6-phosphate aminotransferase (isomerizing)
LGHHTSPRAVGPTHAVPPSPPASAPHPPHPPPVHGERKHGPNALIDEILPVVSIATQDPADPSSALKYEKLLSNIQEVTARSGRVIAKATEGDDSIAQLVEHVIHIPPAPELLLPILEVVPLQFLAYHIAVRRGCDVDQPRNLAKSATVE